MATAIVVIFLFNGIPLSVDKIQFCPINSNSILKLACIDFNPVFALKVIVVWPMATFCNSLEREMLSPEDPSELQFWITCRTWCLDYGGKLNGLRKLQ